MYFVDSLVGIVSDYVKVVCAELPQQLDELNITLFERSVSVIVDACKFFLCMCCSSEF